MQEWQSTFDATNAAMWIIDKNQRILRANKTSERIFQRTNDELVGKYCFEIMHGTTQPIPECLVLRAMNSLHRENMELQIGENWFEVMVDPILDEQGRYDGVVHFVTDISERKRVEEALRESEERFAMAYRTSPISFMIANMEDGRIIEVNDAFTTISGFTREEVLNRTTLNLNIWVHEEDRQNMINTLHDGHSIVRKETILRSKTGNIITALLSAQVIQLSHSYCIISSIEDITERNLALKALRESEDKFKYIFDNSVIGKSITLPTGEMQANQAFCKMTGYSSEELAHTKWQDISHPDEIELTQKIVNSLLSGEKDSARFIKRYIHKNGSVIWVDISTSLRKDGNGKPLYLMTTVNDITGQKMTEETLKKSERHNKIIAEMTTDYVFIVDVDSSNNLTLQWTSENLDQITGRSINDAVTSDLWKNIIHPEDTEYFFHFIEQLLTTAQSGEMECRSIKKSGNERWIHIYARPETDENNRVIAFVGAIKDITERKIAESQIKKLNEELEERVIQRTKQLEATNKELESFSYSVSHDLRSPLRAIHGYTKILLEEYEKNLDEEGRRICNIISSSATQMGGLIDDLLSFSRIGRSRLTPSLLNMKSMAASVIEEITGRNGKEKPKLKIRKLHKGYGDSNLIRIVWINLISNAVKYSSKETDSKIEIGSLQNGKMITYYVKDNGVGFDMKYSHKLFGVFQRLHGESEFEGNGVGLAIVQRIILKHEGKVWAEGEVGKGATFYFSLPADRKE